MSRLAPVSDALHRLYPMRNPIILAAAATTAFYLWIVGGWFHVELLPISSYVKARGWLAVFDWRQFDFVTARLRPLSDFTEVFDAIIRPHTVWRRRRRWRLLCGDVHHQLQLVGAFH